MTRDRFGRQALLAILPRRFELPVRYLHAWLTGRLEHELGVVARCLAPGDVVIDVGANVGLYAFALARRGASVHAFEPVSRCRKVLEAYAHPLIQVHAEAISDEAGKMAMRIPLWRGSSESALAVLVGDHADPPIAGEIDETVSVRTLDSYAFQRVDLLKIDVEGHEQRVLRGARALIEAQHPAILVEIEQRRLGHGSIRDVLELVQALGYEGYFFARGLVRAAREFDVYEHQTRWVEQIETRGFSRDYVNNFLFLPSGKARWQKALGP